jgi:uncharacterized protein YbjQ (UPF0145 family)
MECDDDEMLIATTNDLPGYRIEEVYGEVTGLTVRSRNIGAQLGAGLKSLVGGELKGLTKQLMQSREEALARLTEAASSRGANAVICNAVRRERGFVWLSRDRRVWHRGSSDKGRITQQKRTLGHGC